MRLRGCRKALSLLELLVVIAIVAVLIGLLLPAVQRVRDIGYRAKCLNNLKQIALALHHYHDANRVLPIGCSFQGSSEPLPHLSWCARLLPYLEQQVLWEETQRAFADEPFFLEPPHRKVRSTILPAFACPADGRVLVPKQLGVEAGFTSYLGNEGIDQLSHDGALFLNSRVRLTDVSDGAAQTLLVGERPPSADLTLGWWYAGWGQNQDGSAEMILGVRERIVYPSLKGCVPDASRFRPGRLSENCDALHFWSTHFGGAHFAFCDGSVRFLAYSADPILPALATRAGGEAVAMPD